MPKRRAPGRKTVRRRGKQAAKFLTGSMGLAVLGIGAATLVEKLTSNLGVDLGGLETLIGPVAGLAVGGPLGGIAALITSRLPDFFGDRQTSTRAGI